MNLDPSNGFWKEKDDVEEETTSENSLMIPMAEEDFLAIELNTIKILRVLRKYYKVQK